MWLIVRTAGEGASLAELERAQARQRGRDAKLGVQLINKTSEAIEATGAELRFLPPYSPDFNPIEMAFSKLKAILKKAACRKIEDLWTTIGTAVDTFKPEECANYFQAAGYEPV